jgi:hypothetical protein
MLKSVVCFTMVRIKVKKTVEGGDSGGPWFECEQRVLDGSMSRGRLSQVLEQGRKLMSGELVDVYSRQQEEQLKGLNAGAQCVWSGGSVGGAVEAEKVMEGSRGIVTERTWIAIQHKMEGVQRALDSSEMPEDFTEVFDCNVEIHCREGWGGRCRLSSWEVSGLQ